MLFSSITFLLYFLPIVFILYLIAPKFLKNSVLVLASFFFYGWGEPKYVFLMAVTILAGYGFGILIELCKKKNKGAKAVFILSIAFVLMLLGFFKYIDFVISSINGIAGSKLALLNIPLPIGISFYSFQLISYLADVYRGDEKAQRNPINLGAYISFFPQLIAGPIVRYGDIARQLEDRKITVANLSLGARRFIIGLSKKMLLANGLAQLCNTFYGTEDKSILFFWLYAIAYSLQVYFDFSGYSDMAIGLGGIFGFTFPENFNYPFISGSVTEFWRRWHMTLGGWFRDYVYIPLGGNRAGVLKHLRNILVVWALTGLWHGASWNFVVWGLYYAVFLLLEKYVIGKYLEKLKIVSNILAILVTIIGFMIFDGASLQSAAANIGGLFGIGGYGLTSVTALYCLRSYGVLLIIGMIGATPLVKKVYQYINSKEIGANILTIAEPVILVVLMLLCISFMVDGSFNPFLYFRF